MDPQRFRTDDGLLLRGEIRMPDDLPRGTAVICHALPTAGGSKDHPILWAIRNALARRGVAVLSFNFRGVMGSEGRFTGGGEEARDVRAAVGFVRERAARPTFVAGWSFGAWIALVEALDDDRVAALGLVGFPLEGSTEETLPLPERERLRAFDRPLLLAAGEADQFCPIPQLRAFARRLSAAEVAVLSGTDHFFWRRERELADRVGEFAARLLG